MALLIRAGAIVTVVIAATFLPFASGGHDPLVVPLSGIAWALGRIGLLLVPVGALWLWVSRGSRTQASRPAPPAPAWLVWVTLGVCVFIALVTTLIAFASSGSPVLAAVTAVVAALLMVRISRRLRATRTAPGTPMPRMAAVMLIVAPFIVLTVQTMFVDAAATHARNRAIANGAPLIAEIERYRVRRGAYPESLFSIWGDYKPAIMGIERYHYERSGDAYNVIFKEPSPGFGARRFVVYNPHGKQRITVHEQDRLLLDEAALDADNAGYTIIQPLPQQHWKVFMFLS